MLTRMNEETDSFPTNLSSASTPCANGTCTDDYSLSLTGNTFPSPFSIILILSILCLLGVCFMIFGPLQRSEAYKRVENFTFGRHPIFNIDHREPSASTRYDESMEFSNI